MIPGLVYELCDEVPSHIEQLFNSTGDVCIRPTKGVRIMVWRVSSVRSYLRPSVR